MSDISCSSYMHHAGTTPVIAESTKCHCIGTAAVGPFVRLNSRQFGNPDIWMEGGSDGS